MYSISAGDVGPTGERLAALSLLPHSAKKLPLNAEGLDFIVPAGDDLVGVQVRSADWLAGRGFADQSGDLARKMLSGGQKRGCTRLVILGLVVHVGELALSDEGIVLATPPALVRAASCTPTRWLASDREVRAAAECVVRYPVTIEDLQPLPVRRMTALELADRSEAIEVVEEAWLRARAA